ncbi:MAG TPA: hypothetical protein DEA08_06385 [Planctomycetes bacterium]|nr:hypothetical protein [Planctomycetota bacterium]|tara:strand:+ start:1118 stop:1852 length:735 start_codon:yes stop_codon:yes gene_type:complete
MISRQLREALLAKHAPVRVAKAFRLTENFQRRDLNDVFDGGVVLESTVVFVDICGSAKVTANLVPSEVQAYLNSFYDAVIPEIYRVGGEIDKLIGDGIVAVFGPPFIEVKDGGLEAALKFARKVVKQLAYTPLEVKCAVRRGELCFTTVGNSDYNELTMVGNTLAELHRLEGVSEDRAVNVFAGTPEWQSMRAEPTRRVNPRRVACWSPDVHGVKNLRGVTFDAVYFERWTDPTKGSLFHRLNL